MVIFLNYLTQGPSTQYYQQLLTHVRPIAQFSLLALRTTFVQNTDANTHLRQDAQPTSASHHHSRSPLLLFRTTQVSSTTMHSCRRQRAQPTIRLPSVQRPNPEPKRPEHTLITATLHKPRYSPHISAPPTSAALTLIILESIIRFYCKSLHCSCQL